MLENDPLPVTDEWAITADGTVAVIRGRDYHIDFIDGDGKVAKGPKMAYAWERLTDEAKIALMDSVRLADSLSDLAERQAAANAPKPAASASAPPVAGGGGMAVGVSRDGPRTPTPYIPAQELPDYRPPFLRAAVRADADNNLWIATTHRGPFGAGVVYDVVNRQGVVVDRVQMQPGRTISGFGPGGVVYISARADSGVILERARWKAP